MALKDKSSNPIPYTYVGTPATSMSTKDMKRAHAQDNLASGATGEEIFFHYMRSPGGLVPPDAMLFCSLLTPGVNFKSDIDFAVCIGNKILLIDVKFFRQDGGIYWNTSNDRSAILRNLSVYRSKRGKGEPVHFSQSMVMAKEKIREHLARESGKRNAGYVVESVVVFATDESRGGKVPFTRFLKAPGNVKVLNMNTFPTFFEEFFRGQKRNLATVNAERMLASLVQGGARYGEYERPIHFY